MRVSFSALGSLKDDWAGDLSPHLPAVPSTPVSPTCWGLRKKYRLPDHTVCVQRSTVLMFLIGFRLINIIDPS